MKQSDKLRAERAEKLEKMQAISDAAKGKELTGDAATEFDTLDRDITLIDERIVRERKREEATRGADPVQSPRAILDGEGNQRAILAPTAKLFEAWRERAHPELVAQGSLGAAVRGLAVGKWEGRELLQRALSTGSGATGGFAVPSVLSSLWLDLMRGQSVMMAAGTGTVTMPAGNLTIAGLYTDPVPTSKKENTPFPDSNPSFRPVGLRARTYGVVVTSSVELLNDAPNAEAMIEASLVGAMAHAFDVAGIAGDGSTTGNLDNVTGLLSHVDIPETLAVGTPTDFDAWLDSMSAIEAVNHSPRTVLDNPATKNFLRKITTGLSGDKTKLTQPADYAAMQRLASTNVPAGNSIVGDFTKGVYGITEALTLEATREGGDSFKNHQVLIRAVMRIDYAPLYVAAFHRMKGITTTAP